MVDIYATDKTIPLGRQGENLASRIIFEKTAWAEQYGSGTFQLIVKRHGDPAPYPADIMQNLGTVTWELTNADTAKEGYGAVELYYYVGDVLAKSEIWQTRVLPSLGDAGDDPPEPYQSWVDEVLTAAQSVEEAVEHYPYIDPTTYHWMVWDVDVEAWYDTGVVAQGHDGAPGDDGYSPTVSVTDIPGGHRVTITDADGEHTYDALDGAPGEVSEAELTEKLALKQDTLTDADKQAIADLHEDAVSDVQVNGTSVVEDGVAYIQRATSAGGFGVVTTVDGYAVGIASNGSPYAKTRTAQQYASMSGAAFVGKDTLENAKYDVVKAAMTDGIGAAWTAAEQAAARARMDAVQGGLANYSSLIEWSYADKLTIQISQCYVVAGICFATLQAIVNEQIDAGFGAVICTLPVRSATRAWANFGTGYYADGAASSGKTYIQRNAGNIPAGSLIMNFIFPIYQ